MEGKTNNALLWVMVAVLVVLGVFYFTTRGTTPGEKADTSPIKIGVIAPLTGDAAAYGEEFQRVYNLAASNINETGGVGGRMIELVYEDGKCSGTDATTAAQKLINIDKVSVILGGVCSGETLAAAEITQAARVLLISAGSTSPDITNAGDLVYRTFPSGAAEAGLFADHAINTVEATKAAVISENTDYAQGVRKAFVKSFTDLGGEVVFDEAFNTGDTDFRTLVTKLRTAGAGVLYLLSQTPASAELVLKQMKESGVRINTVYGGDALQGADAIAANPSLYEGMYLSKLALDEGNEKANAMISSYEAVYGEQPSYTSFDAAAYDSVFLVVEAMRESGSTDAEEIANHLNNIKDWAGAVGALTFDENGDPILSFELTQVKSGLITSVE